MARQTRVVLTDDLDGGKASETVPFELDGVAYEIDLSEKNAGKLRSVLQRYASAARKSRAPAAGPPHQRRGRRRATASDLIDPKAVRAWAASNGIKVSPRGRIPADVVEQYRAAGY